MLGGNWKRRLKWAVPVVVLLGVLAVWFLYPRPTDRQLLQALLLRGEHGIETKDVREIMSCISPDYRDGDHSRAELYRMVLQWPRVAERGEVTINQADFEIHPETATGTFDVLFALIGRNGGRREFPLRLKMAFEKRHQGWHRVWLVKSVGGYDEGTLMEGVSDAE